MSGVVVWIGMMFALASTADAAVQTWTSKDGKSVQAEVIGFDWESKAAFLQDPTQRGPDRVLVRQLDLISKIQLFFSKPYRLAYADNKDSIESHEHFKIRFGELQTIGFLLLSTYVASFFAVSWFLALWFTKDATNLAVTGAIAFFAAYIWLSSIGLRVIINDFGQNNEREFLIGGIAVQALIFAIIAKFMLSTSIVRSIIWTITNYAALIILPLTLLVTSLAAQVYKQERTLTMEAADKYLTETWFEPMGLM